MKPNKKHILMLILGPLGMIILMGLSAAHQNNKQCERVEIAIEAQEDNFFINSGGVKNIIGVHERLEGYTKKEIKLSRIEDDLLQTGYVEKVDAHFSGNSVLNVQVVLRKPIARFMNDNQKSFYIDKDGNKMPLSKHFTARAILVRGQFDENFDSTGVISDTMALKLQPMLRFIQENEFWAAQVSEITVDERKKITIYPEVGNLVVHLGDIEDYERKFEILYQFYQKVLRKTGWNYYRKLNLDYKNQIVATK